MKLSNNLEYALRKGWLTYEEKEDILQANPDVPESVKNITRILGREIVRRAALTPGQEGK